MPLIHIAGMDLTIEASMGISVLNNLLQNGVVIPHLCGGKARCGTCRYTVIEGWDNISPLLSSERKKLEELGNPEKTRLGCQSYLKGDVTIRVHPRLADGQR